ncbi:restriction endonuclease subunit S [Hymenobacter psychrotolerans]|nr:restriction endonuclease subunit S [Hymenobacter psychrotolerans]
MILIKPGDLLISGINVAKGAVTVYEGEEDVVATVHYSSYTYDAQKIDITFLKLFLQSPEFFDAIREQIPGGIKTEIKPKHLLPLEVVIPDNLEEQREVAARFFAFQARQNAVDAELDQQQAYLTQLRQALLREAMQGRLLPQNPTDQPAAELLRQLRATKEAAAKPGKRKAAPLFTEEAEPVQGPFEIPESWVWCKLGELCFVTKLAGFEYTNHFKLTTQGDVPVVRAQNVKPNNLLEENLLYLSKETSLLLDRSALKGPSLLITFIGAGIGEVAVFDKKERWHLAPNVAKAELYLKDMSLKYLMWFLLSNFGVAEFFKITKATSQPSLSMGTIREVNIPLSPLAEQQRIVAKLEQLLGHCDALEQRIRESRQLAGQLLQTALREALAGPAATPALPPPEAAPAVAEAPAAPRRGRPRKPVFQEGQQMDFDGLLFE